MNVLEAIQKSAAFLEKKGVDSPRLQAELLLAQALKMQRMKLYLNFERILNTTETDSLRALIKRRGQREPLQHILGSTSFCGLEIAVNPNVLVPRPETEILAELGWQFLNNSASANCSPAVLDFGTGSGCIAIALAVKCPTAKIFAVEVSSEALNLANENARQNNVGDRIHFLHGNGFTTVPAGSKFDLIIGNPPYIPTDEIEGLQPEVRDFDPHVALDGGADGLDFYRRLAREATGWLQPHGKIMLEFGDGQADVIRPIFENQKWIVENVKEDYSRRPRILTAKFLPSSP